MLNFIYGMQISTKSFYKLIVLLWVCIARQAHVTQNNKFVTSLQYYKKEVNEKVDFLHAAKHENVLEIDTIIFMKMVKHFQSSQNSKFAMPLLCVKKEVRDEVNLLHADKRQSVLPVDFKIFITNVSYNVILSLLTSMLKHSQSNEINKFANLCHISKKKFGTEFIFCMQINIKVSKKLTLLLLMETARYVKTIKNINLVIFCVNHYLKHILWGSSHVCCYLFLGDCGQR